MPDPTPAPAPATGIVTPNPGTTFYDAKSGFTFTTAAVVGAAAAGLISSSWKDADSLLIAAGVAIFCTAAVMLINGFNKGNPLSAAQQIGFALINFVVLVMAVFGGMAGYDKLAPSADTTQLKDEGPPAAPSGTQGDGSTQQGDPGQDIPGPPAKGTSG